MNSVVVPFCNEENNQLCPRILESLANSNLEILVVDGSHSHFVEDLCSQLGIKYRRLPNSNRAQRLNVGIRLCQGKTVLLHHPRTLLSKAALIYFETVDSQSWGGFCHSFDVHHPVLRFTSWYSNRIRVRRGIVYLDHCIFAPREWLNEIGGVPEVNIFEDTLLSKALLKFGSPVLRSELGCTSAIRFTQNGILRQSLINQLAKLSLYVGTDMGKISKMYESELHLNECEVPR